MVVDDDFGHITGKVLAVAMANQRIGRKGDGVTRFTVLLQAVEASHPFVSLGANVIYMILV